MDYKTSKEAFVSGMTGSSIGHINLVSLTALASVALHSAVQTRFPTNKPWQFLVEYVILVLPLLLSVSLFALKPGLLLACLTIAIGMLLVIERRETGILLPSSSHPSRASSPTGHWKKETSNTDPVAPLPALTTYRAHMMLLTCLCILAVDFPVFPRSLAKCETFGVSMMDIGVGSFVFSQGIVSAIPLVKNTATLTQPLLPKVLIIARKCIPLMVLGVLRTLTVKGVEYPEHQSEYGTHWNFFFTLALIPVLQVLLHPLMLHFPIAFLGLAVALVQQSLLSAGLGQYILNAPRTTLISANKEGIVSITGYLAIHLFGVSVGTLILPPSPSHFRRRVKELYPRINRKPHYSSDSDSDSDTAVRKADSKQPGPLFQTRENDKTAIELCSYAVLWWAFLSVLMFLGIGGGVSRRMVNLQYIIWVAAYNTSFLLGYIVLDLIFFPSPFLKSTYSPISKLKVQPDPRLAERSQHARALGNAAPELFEAVNRNGLLLFLLANLATGMVNLVLPTMYMPDWLALVVLALYMAGICSIAWWYRHEKLYKL